MAYTHDELDSRGERDKINDALRASDLWRNAIQQMGLNPDGPLNLSKPQQQQLAATIGLSPEDFHIDGAGNINDYHGWKGLPTAAKAAIIGGTAVATAGAAGAFGGAAPGAFGVGSAGAAVPTGITAPAGMVGASGAAGGGGFFSGLAGLLKGNAGSLIGAAGSAIGAGANAATHNRGVQFDADIERARLQQQAERDYFNQTLAREDEGRKKQRSAWDMLHRAAYVQSATGASPGFSPYSKPIQAPSDAQKAAAAGVQATTQQQLAEGNTIPMPQRVGTDVQMQQPGFFEKWGGIIGSGLTTGSELLHPQPYRRY